MSVGLWLYDTGHNGGDDTIDLAKKRTDLLVLTFSAKGPAASYLALRSQILPRSWSSDACGL